MGPEKCRGPYFERIDIDKQDQNAPLSPRKKTMAVGTFTVRGPVSMYVENRHVRGP